MISNLQQKLAAISKEMQQTPKDSNTTELDLSCSVFENTYDMNHLVGDIPLGEILDNDINSLVDVCFASSQDKLSLADLVFFDTETTGLMGGTSTAAFLIGVGYFEHDKFITKQFLMNDYYQESDMISNLNDILSTHRAVVSYNGKAYDRHIVNSRSILNRLPRLLDEKIQLDLLHSTRRLYKRRLDSCSMHSIEDNILNLHRVDDIPGSEIPEVFFNYIKYKDDTMLKKVVEHNLQDIVSMVAIAHKLLYAYNNPENLSYKEDIFSQGLIFEKLDFPHNAKLCYNILGNYPPAIMRQAMLAKREQSHNEAIEFFASLSKMQRFDYTADIEMAKIYEHKIKDTAKALDCTNKALEKATMFASEAPSEIIYQIKKRKTRLAGKLAN